MDTLDAETDARIETDAKASNSFEARPFPPDAWIPELRGNMVSKPTFLPADWARMIQLGPFDPALIELECRAVMDAAKERPARREEILMQADNVAAVIWPVQQIIGNPSDPVTKPATKAMVQAAMFDLVPVLMYFKSVFNRGRPHHCCDLKIDPMFARPDRLYPGHPAYPSGHSTQAHVIAFLYGDMFPKQEQALLEAALRVGQNREVAGLHYPSDTLAGRELARKFVDTMKGVPAFHTLWLTAKAEWPEVALRP